LYSASGFAVRLDGRFFAGAFFADEDLLAEPLFAAVPVPRAFFAVDVFRPVFLAVFDAFAPVFALRFFATGRFTVRLRVVAMLAPRCEEHAGKLRKARRPEGQKARSVFPAFSSSHLLTF
jgi:hypothetical protein